MKDIPAGPRKNKFLLFPTNQKPRKNETLSVSRNFLSRPNLSRELWERRIPENLQSDWASRIENIKAEIPNEKTGLEFKMSALMFIGMAEGILNQLDDAKSEEEFLKVLDSLSNFGAF